MSSPHLYDILNVHGVFIYQSQMRNICAFSKITVLVVEMDGFGAVRRALVFRRSFS